MAFYHTVPSYVSNYSQVVKMGELQFAVSAFPLSPTMSFYQYEQEANPRGLGPPAPNAYKRAVLKEPPKQFKATVLPPKKLGSGWAYGLRVIPIPTGDDDGPDRNSVASRDGRKDYEIWRRWDDCLWFQEEIELEYSIQAREKRRRLVQGKGVKKDGVYLDSKRAASFESLPPGPDPTSVALDLHKYIPKLTKKSTLFRANQAIIDQRQRQFTSLIDALFAPNVPVLIEELRQSLKFRDFFGWWRRDKDFISKQGPEKGKGREPPAIGTIPFYLETSNPSQVFSDTSSSRDSRPPRSKSSRPATTDGSSSGSIRSSTRERTRDHAATRRRKTIATATKSTPGIAVSSASFDGSYESRSASRASLRSVASDEMDPTVLMWDGQEQLNPSDRISPQALLDAFPQTPMVRETFEKIQCPPSPEADSPILGLEALPEEQELELLPPQMSGPEYESGRRPTRSRGNSASDGHHRNAIVFAPETVLGDSELLEIPDRSPTMTNTTSVSSRQSSVFSHNSYALSQRTSASDIPPCPSPRRSFDSCTADAVGYSSSSPASPQTPWCSDNDTFPVGGPSIKWNPRDSVMTIDSIMTDASVDHVLPRSAAKPGDFSATRTFSPGPRGPSHRSRPMSVPEEEGYIEDCDDSILESYLYGIEEMDINGGPGTATEGHRPNRERSSLLPTSGQLPVPFQNRPPEQFHLPWLPASPTSPHSSSNTADGSTSPTSPASTVSAGTIPFRSISVKAYITEEAIIIFRAATETTYAEIREKIFDKFSNQEGISLRRDFPLAYLIPDYSRRSVTSSVYSGIARKRAGSTGSAPKNQSSLIVVQSQEAWEDIVRESDGKLTLRVFE